MAECLAIELHRYGVKVQCVTPGFVDTPAQDDNAFPKPFMVSAETAAQAHLQRDEPQRVRDHLSAALHLDAEG
jgi:NAD(P)-dependent dehydrogenase (short-subunit alcohol dehydrogenase family)